MSHRFFFKLIFILLFALSIEKTLAQTTLNGGDVSGELLKSGSPYIVKATITVPKGKTLVVKPGVQILFDGAYNLNVEGSLQALGTAAQPIVFTAKDTNNGWRGIQIFKNEQGADSNLFEHCTFSYTYQITPDPWRDFGAVLLDSVDNVRFSFCDFFNNTSLSGGAVRLFYSTCRINDCEFVRNRAYDSNSTHPAQGYGPYGSCIVSNFSDVEIKSSNFKFNMSIAPDYIDYNETARASGLVGFDGNRVKILDCLFENNFCDAGSIIRYGGSYYDELKLDTFWMERCVVKNNKIRDKEILALNGSYSNHVRFYVRDCDFIENECLDGLSGSVVLCFNNNGGSNDMVVDNCKLINNKMAQGIFISQGVHGTYSNSLIAGQRGYGIFITQSTKVYVVNSLIHNNWRGFYSFFNSDINLLNSVIAFNGRIDSTKPFPEFENGAPWSYSYGLGVGNRGQLNLYNSIVQDNKDYLGGVANFIGSENREPFPGKCNNSILEGGTYSTLRIGFDSLVRSDTVPFSETKNLYTQKVNFVKPPQGIGVDYASLDVDFHVVETCDTSDVFNRGQNFHIPVPLNIWNGVDRAGNARIQCGTMDIGPYEISGPKGYTLLETPWKDTTLCSNNLDPFNPNVCGYDVNYRWQYSTNNTSWNDLNASSFNKDNLINPKAGYYRLITHQQECNVTDTFGSRQLNILQAPSPNLGGDVYLKNNDSVWLSPGVGFSKYVWTIPGGDTSHVLLRERNYKTIYKKVVWTEVTASNGCKARDTIVVYFSDHVGITNLENKYTVKLYPNPFNEVLFIDVEKNHPPISFRIADMSGKMVMHGQVDTNFDTIDTHELSNGTYILEIAVGNSISKNRLIKM